MCIPSRRLQSPTPCHLTPPMTATLALLALLTSCGASEDAPENATQTPWTNPTAMDPPEMVATSSHPAPAVTAPQMAGKASQHDIDNFVVSTPEDGQPPPMPPNALDECGSTAYTAEAKSLEMYVLFDDSGSWSDEHWETVKGAISGFVGDEASEGLGIALSFFGSECSEDSFAAPEVSMDQLPSHRLELQQVLEAKGKDGQTVTEPALKGGIEFARARIASGVNSRIVMLLVTDGRPDVYDCRDVPEMANDIPAVAAAAAGGLNAGAPVPTYVLAVAGGLDLTERLHAIAEAGGTAHAIQADPATLTEAFNEIRNQERKELPCEYNLPDEYQANNNPDLVNLTFSGDALPRITDPTACTDEDGGWYYDDPTQPTRIHVCTSTCNMFKMATAEQSVNIALGCPTLLLPTLQ